MTVSLHWRPQPLLDDVQKILILDVTQNYTQGQVEYEAQFDEYEIDREVKHEIRTKNKNVFCSFINNS